MGVGGRPFGDDLQTPVGDELAAVYNRMPVQPLYVLGALLTCGHGYGYAHTAS